jgi:hypothetical protein
LACRGVLPPDLAGIHRRHPVGKCCRRRCRAIGIASRHTAAHKQRG